MPNPIPRYVRTLRLPLALVMALSLGCSRSAIIHGAHGTAIEGPIVGADADSITVDVDGTPQTIPRDGIRDIDHPGNGWLLFGALNTAAAIGWGVGALAIRAEYAQSRPDSFADVVGDAVGYGLGMTAAIGFGLIHLAMGVPTTIWGGITWHGSRQRAEVPVPTTTVHVGPGGVLVRF